LALVGVVEEVEVDELLDLERLRGDVLDDLREEVGDVDSLRDEGEESLEGVDLVGVEAGVEERGDGGVVGVIVEVRIRAHPADDPRGGSAGCLEAEHPDPALASGAPRRWAGGWISRRCGRTAAGPPEEGKKLETQLDSQLERERGPSFPGL